MKKKNWKKWNWKDLFRGENGRKWTKKLDRCLLTRGEATKAGLSLSRCFVLYFRLVTNMSSIQHHLNSLKQNESFFQRITIYVELKLRIWLEIFWELWQKTEMIPLKGWRTLNPFVFLVDDSAALVLKFNLETTQWERNSKDITRTPGKRTAQQLSFKWSHTKVLSIELKGRSTLYSRINSIV